MGSLGVVRRVTPLLLVVGLMILKKVAGDCEDVLECRSVSIQTTTSQVTAAGTAQGFALQNITYLNGTVPQSSSISNNVSVTGLPSGTEFTLQYGNSSLSCCRNVTTQPMSVNQLRVNTVTSNSISLIWDQPDEYNSDYSYRVQTNSSAGTLINETTVRSESFNVTDLTAGETYTFTVFTRAADNITESQAVSYSTCTPPGAALNISVKNNNSTDSLGVSWRDPIGKVSSYNITLSGDTNRTTQTNSTQVDFSDLLPGREYSVTIQTVSGGCSRAADPVKEATYPTPPTSLNIVNIETKNISLSWGDPRNMTNVEKTFNITYRSPSDTRTVASNTSNATLQNLRSGTKYTISVVTVGVRQYRSSAVSTDVYTIPMPAKNLMAKNMSSVYVFLTWDQPDEYNSDYSYRVQTNSSAGTLINETTVRSESFNVTDLTAGETYTFTVFTRAADHITESQAVSYMTCTEPGLVASSNIQLNNMNSTNYLQVTWAKSNGTVSNYNVTLSGDVNRTTQTNSTQVDFSDLLPGREYSVTIQTVSGGCSRAADPVTGATYPTPPGAVTFPFVGTKNISLSWGDPRNMTNVEKTFNITYRSSSDTRTVASNTSNATLQNLRSGTKYTISVVTVGVRQYRSSAVSTDVYTIPMPAKNLRAKNMSSVYVFLTWDQPDEYNSDYSYRVQTNSSAGTLINEISVRSESFNVTDLTAGETYTFTVFTRAADNITESQAVSYMTCTEPGLVASSNIQLNNMNSTNYLQVTWAKSNGTVSNYNVTLSGDVNRTTQTNSTQVDFSDLLPGREYSVTIQTVSGGCSRAADPVTGATYPTPPGALTFPFIGTKNISLSWGDPRNMTNVEKTFNITYRSSSDTWTVASNTSNATLQNLRSGTKYTISVVTVGVRQYRSSAVSTDVYTIPMPAKNLMAKNMSSVYVFLTWDQPDEYNSDYSYRVQTNSSAGTLINETTVRSESFNVTDLTAGETYTFTVFTRAADNITESQAVSYTTCTEPGLVASSNIRLNNMNSTNYLQVTWAKSNGTVSNYNITLSGDVNRTTQTNSTQVDFSDLLPGREYSVTIQTVSGGCSRAADPVTGATYPTPPGAVTFPFVGTKNISLSWGDPRNMTNVEKTFNITYRSSSDTRTVASNTSNATLQNLRSGTKYTISVVTVGVLQYRSSAVSTDVYTIPMPAKNLMAKNMSSVYVFLTWDQPDEYNSDYSYRVQTNSSAGTLINETTVRSESFNVTDLTAGETYTFTVFTRAADNITESQAVSYSTCTSPGAALNISAQNNNSTDSLGVSWRDPIGKVSSYNITLSGDVNRTTQTNSTQVDFSDLLPGREYSVTIQTVSGGCSRAADPVKEATYPTPPTSLNIVNIETKNISLSWGDPRNMTNVEKTFNITYRSSSDTRTVTSNTSNATLQNLRSGTKYTISVVTVSVRQYRSSAVSTDVYTIPMPAKNLRAKNMSSVYVFLTWDQPDEYNSDYSYRVQTNSSAGTLINETTVRSESFNVTDLTAGETYTFTVFTRAADHITESQAVSYSTCTEPGLVASSNIRLNNMNSTNYLQVIWAKSNGTVSNYNITLSGDVNRTTQTNSTQVDFSDLLPGREYSVTIQTVSGGCSRAADPVKEATYPTPPTSLNIVNIETKNISLSWGDPRNMTNVEKTFNITYRSSSDTQTVTSNTSNATLQNLRSGTKYTISVVTVGVRQYRSSAVSTDVYTIPMPAKNLRAKNMSSVYVFLTWDQPDEYNSDYSYRVQTNSSAGTLINETTVRSESFNVTDLTAGETYTFTVFTRAADHITESQAVSYSTCTPPGAALNISVKNNNSTDSLGVSWRDPIGKVSSYNITLSGDTNRTIQTNSTQVDFSDLLPGREYSVTIQTVSGGCSRAADPVKEATYPTPPGAVTFPFVGTKNISLSWGDPRNMTNVEKTFNITYRSSSDTRTVASNTSNATLQNLRSGTKYTISVVTVGVRQYRSSAVSTDVYTIPMPAKNLMAKNMSSVYVFLTWDQPDEYNSDYSYRVQTNSSAGTLINETTVRSESFNVTDLTAGETYTFTVFTRAADHITESQAVSYSTCTVPGISQNITIRNNKSTNFLGVSWMKAEGKVSYYSVTLSRIINGTLQTNSTRVDFPLLLPGREYSVTIQTVSGGCSRAADPVKEATYPTPPGSIDFVSIGTDNVSLSWGNPINMTDVEKYFIVTYSNSSGIWIVSSNTSNITLQNLRSGTKYTISVVTVGARQYRSSAVSKDMCTVPAAVLSPRCSARHGQTSLSLTWTCPDSSFRNFGLTVTSPGSSKLLEVPGNCSAGSPEYTLTDLKYHTNYTISITAFSCQKESDAVKISPCWTSVGRPPDINTTLVEPSGSPLHNQFDFTFSEFNDSNGPIVAYAVIVAAGIDVAGQKPAPEILSKTYSNHKSKSTNTYVACIIESKQSKSGVRTARVGDGSQTLGYTNGPLDPLTSYWVSVAGFTDIQYDNNKVSVEKSLVTFCPYSEEFKTAQNTGVIIGAVVGCILGVAAISIMGFFIWWKRRNSKGEGQTRDVAESKMKNVKRAQSMKSASFASHFAKHQADMNLGFSREYERLAPVGVTQSKTAAEDPGNRRKNRYTNVLPYDASRVKLSIKDNPTDDYINANFIPGHRSDKEFIAAQGPLPHTVNDFWRMVWEKNICAIVILTKCVESGKVKCEEYWPTGEVMNLDKLLVSFKGEIVLPEWTIRDFTVTNKINKEIQVRQFHLTAWPDHGVPKSTNLLISFRNLVCDYTKYSPSSPILVHCSAGVGRTGTFIALDRIIRQIEAEDKVDIYGTVYDLRMHRALMVQTESQYIFLNQCALDFIKARQDDKSDLIYQNTGAVYEYIDPSQMFSRSNV